VNLFDAAAIALLVVAVVLGFRSGALPQIGGLAGAVAGGALAILSLPLAEQFIGQLEPAMRAIAVIALLLAAVAIGEGIGSAIGREVAFRLDRTMLGGVDRIAGAFVGAAQAVLIVWLAGGLLAGGLLAAGPLPRLAQQANNSVAVRTIAGVLPPPTDIAVRLGRLLDASGLPDVFVGLEPIPAAPVDRPNDPRARAIAANAERSTVKVSAQTCGAISSGTGFAIARDYVVTNAHVVAGGRTIRVALGNATRDAVAVLFDPDLDVALLHVDNLNAPALSFAPRDPRRGAIAAAIGFPGGGNMTVIPAAVTNRYDATGRDIYGSHRVTRAILELRAAIAHGDSGGPLVLGDGSVGGIVFAESRAEQDVGYALGPTEVAAAVTPAVGRTAKVATGACIN
jgi:S1-C subfamily serine protease